MPASLLAGSGDVTAPERPGADRRLDALLEITPVPACGAAEDARLLHEHSERLRRLRRTFLGHPVNLEFDYRPFGGMLDVLWNTVGDPGAPDTARTDRQPFERPVVRFLAGLAGADPAHVYGYVTSGGAEGNFFGMYLGRRRLPDAPLYYSAAAHYTVERTAELLRMDAVRVPCRRDGGLDTRALRAACGARAGRGAVVVATVGTTMLGGVDDLPAVRAALAPAGEIHLHVDAALGGLLAAFSPHRPPWGFESGADTLTVSGHKLIGTPVPCGIAMAREHLVPRRGPYDYLGATDATLACSRNALTPMLLWYALRRLGSRGLAARVRRCLATADYACERLAALGRRPWRHPSSATVVFDRPPAHVCRRWHLATSGNLAHLVAMPHVTRAMIDSFCRDL
ncbi:histidine decarboxylase [Streptomyces gamaensis]|uniref:Histidine decarboxylase n=1 Tax=Streptomyces gamaensis TaxID=1763542 RepID=A0ABW0YU55_9ACTN